MDNIDYIVIGCGMSGLNIGTQISKKYKNKKCYIFEKSSIIGGRVQTIYKKNFVYESGAARFNSNHKLLIKLLKKYNLYKERVPIPSFWENINLDKNKNIIDTELNIHEFIQNFIKIYNNKKNKSYLQKNTVYDIIKNNYGLKYAKYLENNYSYYSEICVMNAYDAIELLINDLNENNKFYILKCGFSKLIECMKKDFLKNKNNRIFTNSSIINLDYKNDIFYVKIKNNDIIEVYKTSNIIFACDAKSLQSMNFLKNKFNLAGYINSVNVQPLLRTYALYDKKNKDTKLWLEQLKKTVTNEKIKFIIPIYNGLVMISYTDGKYAKYWQNKIYNQTQQEYLNKTLENLYPNNKVPKKPLFIENYYWDNGACYWKKNVHSDIIFKKMLKPFNYNLFFVGDSFSKKQAWMEGALETSDKVFELL